MPRGHREPPLPQGPAIFLYISIENFPPAGHTVFDGSRKAGVFMDRQSRKAGWGTALCMFLLLCWAAAPWVAAAQRLTAPEERAEEAASLSGGPPLIALTFDDGPRRSTTTALLDGLCQRGVHATFFLIGAQLEDNEDLIRRMDAEGHQIGIHTYDHVRLTGLSKADFDAQVARTRQALTGILGHDGFLLRPPYGLTDGAARQNAGCPIILWSIDPEDWGDQDAAREVEHVVSHAYDGAIILMHDIFPASVEAALEIVDRLHAQGYLFVTIDELFQARHIQLQPGQVYREAAP